MPRTRRTVPHVNRRTRTGRAWPLAAALLLLATLFAVAVALPPAAGAQEITEDDLVIPGDATTDPTPEPEPEPEPEQSDAPSDEPKIMYPDGVRYGLVVEPPSGLADKLGGGLNAVTGVIGEVLFFDLAFNQLHRPMTDRDGDPVYEQVPETVELPSDQRVLNLHPEGEGYKPWTTQEEEGTLVAATSSRKAGVEVIRLGPDHTPVMTVGEQKTREIEVPFLVVFLAFGAIYFTIYHRFINLRGFKHAIEIVRGKYQSPHQVGDVSPFKALTSALSATVGLGNISGVAIAMVVGGPGALFWMMFLGVFGMTAKFHETTLSQLYRTQNDDGTMSGGPMYFISRGFRDKGGAWEPIGKVLAVAFAVLLMGGALGGGNMFQSNQAFAGFHDQFLGGSDELKTSASIGFGILMSVMVGFVVIGGITRIGTATSVIVPFMAGLYVLACLVILAFNLTELPSLIGLVLSDAFAGDAFFGGMIGAMMQGFKRAAFSSEAGVGSSAVAHSAAKTDEPVQEGLVASLEPFIDTIVVCFMTGMVVLITGVYANDSIEAGTPTTIAAFSQNDLLGSWFPYVLTVCILLFAFSTMISWCYYGERAWGYLFGIESVLIFRIVFVVFVFVGAVASLKPVIDFSDLLLLSCAVPNIIGGIVLAPKVKRQMNNYFERLRNGDVKRAAADPGADI